MSDCHTVAPVPSSRKSNATTLHSVALVGPPNSGKSTLFNRLTGLNPKVANFPGVTVEHRLGRPLLGGDHTIQLVDLPGVYSLHPRSEDEQVTSDILRGLPATSRVSRYCGLALQIDLDG